MSQRYKRIVHGAEARKALAKGIDQVADAVKVTLGPKGRLVLLASAGRRGILTKDGVSVAREIVLEDPLENEGAKLCIEVASKCNTVAGDGPQPLYSKVLTPNGFVEMGSLKIGDKICGTNKSIQEIEGIFPKGLKQIIEIKFTDGRVVECCEDHLWTITNSLGKKNTFTTKNLMDQGILKSTNSKYKYHKFYVERSEAEFTKQDVLLDPFLIGLLIGDGSLSGTGSVELSLGKNKEHVLDKIILPEGLYLKTTWVEHKNYYRVKIQGKTLDGKTPFDLLREIGLFGTKSSTKFIPKEYLYSDYKSRLSLLDGLTCTDGYINSKGLIEYSTISDRLANDYKELMYSLGRSVHYRLLKRKKNSSYSSNSIHRISELKGRKYGTAITSITPTNKYTEMQCIKVSNLDHLYFTDNYILTHNTTSSCVLAQAIVKEGLKQIELGANPIAVKNGIEQACKQVLEFVEAEKTLITDNSQIKYIATISGNSTEVGDVVSDAFIKVGKDGVVTLEPSKSSKTTLNVTEGLRMDRGWLNEYFVTDSSRMITDLEDVHILLWDGMIEDMKEIATFLNGFYSSNPTANLLIICDDLTGNALPTVLLNNNRGITKVFAAKSPGFGERKDDFMQDLANLTGGVYFNSKLGRKLDGIKLGELGRANRVRLTRDDTTFTVEDNKERVDNYINILKDQVEATDNEYDKKRIGERIARLSNGIAVIKLGAVTDTELLELKDRYEDAISATKAGIEEGIVVGGGVALVRAQKRAMENVPSLLTEDELVGWKALVKCLSIPCCTIASNAGVDSFDNILNTIKSSEKPVGYNAKTGTFDDMQEAGIIDPFKVTRSALEYSTSIATMVLTTETLVVEIPGDQPPMNQYGM